MNMVYCSECGYEYDSLQGLCPACENPEIHLLPFQIKELAEEHGPDSNFAKALKSIRSQAASALGSIKSDKKATSSAANGKLGGRPRRTMIQAAMRTQAEGLAVQAGLEYIMENDFDADAIAAHIKSPDDWDGLSEWALALVRP